MCYWRSYLTDSTFSRNGTKFTICYKIFASQAKSSIGGRELGRHGSL